jgi:stage IV sporulation protein FB
MGKYWIMKKSYLKIHPLTVFFLFLAFITGYFKYIIYFMSLIFIHEIGHVTAALFCNWHVKKVILLPFGGMTVFEEQVNTPIREEFFVVVAGPLYQHLFYLLLCLLGYQTSLLTTIHLFLLGFNLLPIYPLDGSKLFLLFFEKCLPFYHSQIAITYLSCLTIGFFCFFPYNILLLILLFFLSFHVCQFYKKIPFLFQKFILERKLYSFSFSRKKTISQVKEMKRDYEHYFIKNGRVYREKEYLHKNF